MVGIWLVVGLFDIMEVREMIRSLYGMVLR